MRWRVHPVGLLAGTPGGEARSGAERGGQRVIRAAPGPRDRREHLTPGAALAEWAVSRSLSSVPILTLRGFWAWKPEARPRWSIRSVGDQMRSGWGDCGRIYHMYSVHAKSTLRTVGLLAIS